MPHKQKATMEEKVKLVRACIEGKMSKSDAGQEAGVDRKTIYRWIAQYEAEGSSAFLPRERNRVYPPELKQNAVQDYLKGEGSVLDLCRKYKIHAETQLRDWIKVYNAHGDLNSRKHSGGGSYMKKARSTTQEERLQIVKECLESGRNYGEMALKYNGATNKCGRGRCGLRSLERQAWRIGAESGRKTKCRGRSWSVYKLRMRSSSMTYIWQKWRTAC